MNFKDCEYKIKFVSIPDCVFRISTCKVLKFSDRSILRGISLVFLNCYSNALLIVRDLCVILWSSLVSQFITL